MYIGLVQMTFPVQRQIVRFHVSFQGGHFIGGKIKVMISFLYIIYCHLQNEQRGDGTLRIQVCPKNARDVMFRPSNPRQGSRFL